MEEKSKVATASSLDSGAAPLVGRQVRYESPEEVTALVEPSGVIGSGEDKWRRGESSGRGRRRAADRSSSNEMSWAAR
jgi:hypothetical protein